MMQRCNRKTTQGDFIRTHIMVYGRSLGCITMVILLSLITALRNLSMDLGILKTEKLLNWYPSHFLIMGFVEIHLSL